MTYNFNAGPSHLDNEILNSIAISIKEFNNSGMSILEFSHRSNEFELVLEESKSLLIEFLELKEEQEIFFMQGGASFQFHTLPYNFLDANDSALYIDTGRWSLKAIEEARRFAHIDVVASSSSDNYRHIPNVALSSKTAKYLHITSNNTIYGTQYKSIPNSEVPIVADMSSDILGRTFDYNRFDMIYAGAQKNLGTAGVTIVVCKKDFLSKAKDNLAPMLSYKTIQENNSLYNTPPVLAIYVMLETLRWLKRKGGVKAIDQLNQEKATLLYSALDNSELFEGSAKKEDRSNMNVCFHTKDVSLEKAFLDFASEKGIRGIKGHRSAGGFRASLYNCIPLSFVEVLCSVLEDFERKVKH